MNVEPVVPINGNPEGKFLFAVIIVNEDHSKDTTVSLYQSDDEDELFGLVMKDLVDGEDAYEDETEEEKQEDPRMGTYRYFRNKFEEDWGAYIIPTLLGEIKP